MKKFFTLFTLILFYFTISFAQTKEQLWFASEILNRKIASMNQLSFKQETFAELAFLKRTYKLDSFNLDKKKYINKLNDYYYKSFFPYSKFLDENAVVTEDCFKDEDIAKTKKLLFYSIYPKHIKLPQNIIDQIEEQSTTDEFFGPYYALTNIYFLKKFNYNNLSAAQKEKLTAVEKFLSNLLYTKYVKDVPTWPFYKILSLKVLKMNNDESVKNIDITAFVAFIINNSKKPLELSEEDRSNLPLMNKFGYQNMLEYEANALLWIFLLELNKN